MPQLTRSEAYVDLAKAVQQQTGPDSGVVVLVVNGPHGHLEVIPRMLRLLADQLDAELRYLNERN